MGRRHRARAAPHDPPAAAHGLTAPPEASQGWVGWPAVLTALVAGQDLTGDTASAALAEVLAGRATSAQLAGFLIGLRAKGETWAEMTGLVEALLGAAERFELPDGPPAIDTCGTGGGPLRQQAAFNVSTLAALVAAAAGARVCKHGNRAASSTSGSADLLEALGVVPDLGPAGVVRCVVDAGIGFCFAPRFHPAMRHAGPTRRELGVRTVLNLLGPLVNPAGVRRQVIGVGDPAAAERVVEVLAARGTDRALVVSGHDGLDELTTTTTSTMLDLADGAVRRVLVDPGALGLATATAEDLRGGDGPANAAIAAEVLGGGRGAHRDIVVLNAAAALVVAGVVDDLASGCEAAAAALDDGRAAERVERLVAASREAAAAEA